MEVDADRRAILDGEDGAGKRQLDGLAVVVERRPLEIRERSARREDLLLEVVTAFDGELRLSQNRQTSRIGLRSGSIVSQSEERPAHSEGTGTRVSKVEL
jgi:hypothetical protein